MFYKRKEGYSLLDNTTYSIHVIMKLNKPQYLRI